jgi:pimeloyl-ACP methyl ester carboxylesterase
MVRDITARELNDWLKELDNGVDAFKKKGLIKKCRINRCLIKKGLILARKGLIKKRLIKKCLKKCLIRSNYNPPLFKLFRGCIPWLRIVLAMRNCLPEVISDFILDKLRGFATDTAIFCLHDQRSSYYEIREKVLKGAVDELIALLKDKDIEGNELYQQIIVVGHSLGAVIAYDAFNRIARDISAPKSPLRINVALVQKVKGLVTFGSFLDVVAFFFQAHVPDLDKPRGIKAWLAKVVLFFKEHVPSPIKRVLPCLFWKKGRVHAYPINMEKQITDQRHAFKKKLPATYGVNPVQYQLLKDVRWLNLYHPDDFISNCELIAYEFDPGDAQVKCDTPIKAGCCKSLLYKIPIVKLFIKFLYTYVKCDTSINVGCWKYVPIVGWFKKHMGAHNSYWTNDKMYEEIASRFF